MLGGKTKTAVIMAAQDFKEESVRAERLDKNIAELGELGLTADEFDLRKYFEDSSSLEADLTSYDFIWVRGGNVFTLRQAMALSGLDKILPTLIREEKIVYGGYSAGACVLAPSLHGTELVDPLDRPGVNYPKTDIIWEGLGLIQYAIAPHYKSDHPESADVDKYVEYLEKHNMPYKALRDGEVIIVDK